MQIHIHIYRCIIERIFCLTMSFLEIILVRYFGDLLVVVLYASMDCCSRWCSYSLLWIRGKSSPRVRLDQILSFLRLKMGFLIKDCLNSERLMLFSLQAWCVASAFRAVVSSIIFRSSSLQAWILLCWLIY